MSQFNLDAELAKLQRNKLAASGHTIGLPVTSVQQFALSITSRGTSLTL